MYVGISLNIKGILGVYFLQCKQFTFYTCPWQLWQAFISTLVCQILPYKMHLTHQKYPLLCLKSNHLFETIYNLYLFYNISSFKRLNSKLYRYIGKRICFGVWTFFARLLTNYFFAKYLRPLYIFSQRRHDIKCNVKGSFDAFIELKMKVLYVYIPSAFSLSNTIYIILLYFSHIFSQ